ncbi:MAG TPA: MFS transporter [Candidatus Moranbacteria bacterium]|nr:MFS transporter [Candidatus Moranbacteria bacterium]
MLHHEKLNLKKIRIISAVSLLVGLSEAFFLYIMSSFFKLASGTENVGVFYLIAYGVILIIFLNLHKIVRKFGKSDVLVFSLVSKVAIITGLLFLPSGYLGITLVILYLIFGNLEWVMLDIILESYSIDNMSGRIRGTFLTIMNLGFLLGPFLSIEIFSKFQYFGVFLILLIINTAVLFIETNIMERAGKNLRSDLSLVSIFRKIAKRENILHIYLISFTLEFFYAVMVIYAPIYLIDLGISWKEIGIIFTIMLVPFVLFQYPVGMLADKKLGEKEMLVGAVFLMGISTLAVYFINSKSILVWSAVFFLTRVGASLIEILRDSYFYKRIDASDVDLINIFRTARPGAYIVASIVSALVIFFFSIKAVFVLLAITVFLALYPVFRLKDSK